MTRLIALLFAALAALALPGDARAMTAYDFSFTSIEGEPMPLAGYRGKALLVVNTASFCGFTPQYEGLQALWREYRDRGLVVIGVPSNDFGQQEPGSTKEIKQFCETNFDIDFPMTEKYVVRGADAHPFYKWAAAALGTMSEPRWNFYKILVAPDGTAVDWFASTTGPDSAKLRGAVEKVLPK
jgi:glutathione peroxidase